MIRRLFFATTLILLASAAHAFWQSRDSNYNIVVSGSSQEPSGNSIAFDFISNMPITPGVPRLGVVTSITDLPAIISSGIWNN